MLWISVGGWCYVKRATFAAVTAPGLTIVLLILTLFAPGCGCRQEAGEGFAIYLSADDTPPAKLAILSHVEIAATPILSRDDIVSYSRETHEIEVTRVAYLRVRELEVPLTGRSFAVCVDRHPVYVGAFMTSLWSGTFDGVVILQWLTVETSLDHHVLRLELGYPTPEWFSGQDPRADPSILEALERAEKLD
jgi:hypothetical protein